MTGENLPFRAEMWSSEPRGHRGEGWGRSPKMMSRNSGGNGVKGRDSLGKFEMKS